MRRWKKDLFPIEWMRCKLRRRHIIIYQVLSRERAFVSPIETTRNPTPTFNKLHLCGQLFFSTVDIISSVHVCAYNTQNSQHFIIAWNFIKSLFSHLWPYCALFYFKNNEKTSSYYKYQHKKRVLASNVAFMYILMISHNVNL